MQILVFLALFCSSLMAQDSIGEFFEDRFALHPPTEEEQNAVVQAVQIFFEKIKTNDIPGAYFITTSSKFQAATSLDKFRIFIQTHEADFSQKLDKHSVTFTNAEKSKANLSFTLKGKQKGQRFHFDFELENEDGFWKIVRIRGYEVPT